MPKRRNIKKKKRKKKKLNILNSKKTRFDLGIKFEEVLSKWNKIIKESKKGLELVNKSNIEKCLSEFKAISIQVKNSNLSKANKKQLLQGLEKTLRKDYLKIKSLYFPEERKKIDKYYKDILKNAYKKK